MNAMNITTDPTAAFGAGRSAGAVHAASRRWLLFSLGDMRALGFIFVFVACADFGCASREHSQIRVTSLPRKQPPDYICLLPAGTNVLSDAKEPADTSRKSQ